MGADNEIPQNLPSIHTKGEFSCKMAPTSLQNSDLSQELTFGKGQEFKLKIPYYDTVIQNRKKILYIELVQCSENSHELVMKNFEDFNLFLQALQNFTKSAKNELSKVS